MTSLEGLDIETREAAEAAARRSGLSLEDWVAAISDQTGRHTPAARRARRRDGDDLDAAIAKVTKATRQRQSTDFEAIIAAAAAESERQARDHAARTAIALDSVASWIEQAEERLNDATRAAADQQDRLASALSEALGAIKDRLDSVERRLAPEQPSNAEPHASEDAPSNAPLPLADALADLRSDMARLAMHLDKPREDPWTPVVEGIRAEIERLRASLSSLATREEVTTLEHVVRDLAVELAEPRVRGDMRALVGSLADLQQQVHQLSTEMSDGIHRRIATEVDAIVRKVDFVAANGVDRTIVEDLGKELAEMRQALAQAAEPQRIERLSGEVASLGRQMAELRLNQISRSDFAGLKGALEEIRSALRRSEEAQNSTEIPDQLKSLNRRLDALMSRPEPANFDALGKQLAVMTDRIAALADRRSEQSDAVTAEIGRVSGQIETVTGRVTDLAQGQSEQTKAITALMDRLSGQVEAVADHLGTQPAPLLERFDRLEEALSQVGQNSDTANVELMLRSIADRLGQAPAQVSLDGLERQIETLASQLQQISTSEPIKKALAETVAQVKGLRDEAAVIAERAAKAVLAEAQATSRPTEATDLVALKESFAELKAVQANADRKTQQTLKAVHNALETLMLRFPAQQASSAAPKPTADEPPSISNPSEPPSPAVRLESAVRRLQAAALSQVEEIAPPRIESDSHRAEVQEIFLEPGTPRAVGAPASSFTASQGADPGSVRTNFIAAARRAAQAATSEKSDGNTPAAEGEATEPTASSQTLIERIRQSFDAHRRPLLLSLALLVLAAGTVQIATSVRGSRDLAAVPPAASPAAGELALPSLPTPPPIQETLQRSGFGKAPDAVSAAPATTGSLFEPTGTPAAPVPSGSFTPVPPIAKRILDMAGICNLPPGIPAPLREAALAGDPAAVYELAARAAEGRGLLRDPALAARLFEKAAEAGLPMAQYRVGNLYEKGLGVTRDAARAKGWYERAAAAGNARSMHNLAVLLAEGVDGKPDYAAAQRWFLEAAEFGIRDSQFNLGVLLARGLGTRQDLAQSYQWFALAAAQGDEEAGRKRDEVGARLSATDLAAARGLVEQWRARPLIQAANEVAPPAQGWTAVRSQNTSGRG